MGQKALQGRLTAQLRVNLAIVFQLDPGLAGVVELVQRQIGNAFEHRQEPAFDLPPKRLLFSVLERRVGQRVFEEHAQPGESRFGFGGDHG